MTAVMLSHSAGITQVYKHETVRLVFCHMCSLTTLNINNVSETAIMY